MLENESSNDPLMFVSYDTLKCVERGRDCCNTTIGLIGLTCLDLELGSISRDPVITMATRCLEVL